MQASTGPIIFDLIGTELTTEDQEILNHPLIGGIIFFSRNFESPKQMQDLCQKARAACQKPILLSVDQEGGRVQRFKKGMTPLPPLQTLGKVYESSKTLGLEFATLAAWIMSTELLSLGIDLSFAPVLDLDKGLNTVIADRAFHEDPAVVTALALSYMEGMKEAGMANCAKHFPGHGSVSEDSHLALPIDTRDLSEIENNDAIPFYKLIPHLQSLMAAHIIFPNIDAQTVGYSEIWLKQILREKCGFTGMIFSDALDMKGAEAQGLSFADRAQSALSAGCDMVLICNDRAGLIQALDHLPSSTRVDPKRFSQMQGNWQAYQGPIQENLLWQEKHRRFLSLLETQQSKEMS